MTFKEKFNNNKLSYKTYVKDSNYETSILSTDNLSLFNISYAPSNIPTDDVTRDITIKTFSEHDTPENELEKLSYIYDEAKDAYVKYYDKEIKIEYLIKTKKIVIYKQNDLGIETIKYCVDSNKIDYCQLNKNKQYKKFRYNLSNNSLNCIEGDCKNYKNKIDYILSIYKEINTILQ